MVIPKYLVEMPTEEFVEKLKEMPDCPKCGAPCDYIRHYGGVIHDCVNFGFYCKCSSLTNSATIENCVNGDATVKVKELYYKWMRHLRRYEKKYGQRST